MPEFVCNARSESFGFGDAHPLNLHTTSFLCSVPRHASHSGMRWHLSSPRAVRTDCSELDPDSFVAFIADFVFWGSCASARLNGDQHVRIKHMMPATTREEHNVLLTSTRTALASFTDVHARQQYRTCEGLRPSARARYRQEVASIHKIPVFHTFQCLWNSTLRAACEVLLRFTPTEAGNTVGFWM